MRRTYLTILVLVLIALVFSVVRGFKSEASSSIAGKTVTITNFKFTPAQITVKAGTTVMWVNKEGTHTVTADDNSWDSGNLSAGKSFNKQFGKPGTYSYHCTLHGSPGGDMSGTITVVK